MLAREHGVPRFVFVYSHLISSHLVPPCCVIQATELLGTRGVHSHFGCVRPNTKDSATYPSVLMSCHLILLPAASFKPLLSLAPMASIHRIAVSVASSTSKHEAHEISSHLISSHLLACRSSLQRHSSHGDAWLPWLPSGSRPKHLHGATRRGRNANAGTASDTGRQAGRHVCSYPRC